MSRIAFFVVLSLIFGFITYNLIHFGVFKTVEISEATKGPYFLIYKEHVGPYHETVDAITDVEKWAKVVGLDCSETFGEYFDNPSVVEQERLRSNGGCVLTSAPAMQIPQDLKVLDVPAKKYVVATFTGSPAIGPYKVYGKAMSYISEHRLQAGSSIIEIYKPDSDKKGMTTTYLFSVKE